MTTRVDGHSWALSAIDELKVDKIITPLNKDHIPITDSPVVVQQHMLPPKKFVLLSAQVCTHSVNVETRREAIFNDFIFCNSCLVESFTYVPSNVYS